MSAIANGPVRGDSPKPRASTAITRRRAASASARPAHVVRVSGTVTTYRGKPEMALRDPGQLVLAPPPGPGSVAAAPPAPAPVASSDRSSEELRRALSRIETRLEAIESRLTTIEQASPDDGEPAAAPGR